MPIDMAIVSGIYQHMPDREAFLKHVKGWLPRGGHILICYGTARRLVGPPEGDYPEIAGEIFKHFTPVSQMEILVADPNNGEETGWRLYLGRKA